MLPWWCRSLNALVVLVCLTGAASAYLTDTGTHVPPTCGLYAYDTFTPASATFPAVGSTWRDPTFGETITRLSNIYPSTSGSGILYGIRGYWNADSTAFLHQKPASYSLINPSTGATIRDNVPYPTASTDLIAFDPVDPDIYYYNSGTSLMKYSVSGNTSTTVKNFGSTVRGTGTSADFIDRTGDIFLLGIGGNFRIWKKSTDTLYTGSIAIPGDIPPGWAGLTPDGNYVVFSQLPNKTSYAVNHGTTTLSTTGVLFWDRCFTDHGNLISPSDGFSYMITAWCSSAHDADTMYQVRVSNDGAGLGEGQLTLPGNRLIGGTGLAAGDAHIACAGAASGTYRDWCYAAFYQRDDTATSTGAWLPYKQELVMIQTVAPFTVRRLLHHHARLFFSTFCRQVRPSTNKDGSKVIFSTPFGYTADLSGCGYSDIYRYDAP